MRHLPGAVSSASGTVTRMRRLERYDGLSSSTPSHNESQDMA